VIVCHCRAVNHTTVLDLVAKGVGCPDEVAARCGAGSVCGGCRPTVQSLLVDGALVPGAAVRLPARARRTATPVL
jgi:bacterioferritin-associated ferredoxin